MPPDPMCSWPPKETMACCRRDVRQERNPVVGRASSAGIGGLRYGEVDRDPVLLACWAPGGTATAWDNHSSVTARVP